ncbi:MAG: hypothetical protein RMM53_06265 [Bacteroidia bacterium]|nr:hypothetical protein [Bacteroidia bacterium]MDW8333800.1 hypothetical protein [Bacteroidia bacterium]
MWLYELVAENWAKFYLPENVNGLTAARGLRSALLSAVREKKLGGAPERLLPLAGVYAYEAFRATGLDFLVDVLSACAKAARKFQLELGKGTVGENARFVCAYADRIAGKNVVHWYFKQKGSVIFLGAFADMSLLLSHWNSDDVYFWVEDKFGQAVAEAVYFPKGRKSYRSFWQKGKIVGY